MKPIKLSCLISFLIIVMITSAKTGIISTKARTPETACQISEAEARFLKECGTLFDGTVEKGSWKTHGKRLHDAAEKGYYRVVDFLINKGFNVNDKEKRYGWSQNTPLYKAASMNRLEVMEVLISKGADVNARDKHGSTPLNIAAGKGHIKAVKLLLENGADIN